MLIVKNAQTPTFHQALNHTHSVWAGVKYWLTNVIYILQTSALCTERNRNANENNVQNITKTLVSESLRYKKFGSARYC
jgi:hypothetical protein